MKCNFKGKDSSFYKNRKEKGYSMFGMKKCLNCGKEFELFSPRQKYCGSKKNKTGCSWDRYIKKTKERAKQYAKPTKFQHIFCHKCNIKFPKGNNSRRFYCENCTTKKIKLRLRFLILERDKYTCQYCGKKAPEVILEIDHIFPKSKGGNDSIENLKTACEQCNLGKGDYILKNNFAC